MGSLEGMAGDGGAIPCMTAVSLVVDVNCDARPEH